MYREFGDSVTVGEVARLPIFFIFFRFILNLNSMSSSLQRLCYRTQLPNITLNHDPTSLLIMTLADACPDPTPQTNLTLRLAVALLPWAVCHFRSIAGAMDAP